VKRYILNRLLALFVILIMVSSVVVLLFR